MRNRFALLLALAPLTLAAPAALAADAPASALPRSFADVVEKLSPAVVNVSTTQKVKGGGVQLFGMSPDEMENDPQLAPFRDFLKRFGGGEQDNVEREVTSLGSGFIIDPSGFVITNNHVIDDAEEITVITVDNTKYKAKVVGRDKKSDLALLKIDAQKPLPFVPLGDSDQMRVGDWVIAIGNPYGLGGTVTHGIISARERSIDEGPLEDFLQTDAPINRGNSGGPLFNEKGEVIGITTAIFSPSGGNIGLGFAIPANLAKPVIEQLKAHGRVHRAWLGVKIEVVSDEMADSIGLQKAEGALVVDVTKGSPADKAGLKSGDVITKFDGKPISEMRFLPRLVADTTIGKTVEIVVWRQGGLKTFSATLTELTESQEAAEEGDQDQSTKSPHAAGAKPLLGMELAPLTPQMREQYNVDDAVRGVLVTGVTHGSEAAQREVQEGDVITSVNGEPVGSLEEMRAKVEAARGAGRKFILLRIVHGKETAFITLPAKEEKK